MKTRMMLLMIALTLTSCAHLSSVSLTQVPADRSHPVEAEATSWGILSLYGSNGFADEAISELREKCPGGKLSGVYTKLDGRYYFLWGTRTIQAHAFCETGKKI